MAKKTLEGIEKFNRVHPVTNAVFTAVFAILALICIVPVIFIVIISFSSDTSIQQIGYSFIPQEWSLEAYSYLWNNREMIGRALVVSVVVTVVGCILGLYLTATMGYCLSRPNFKLKGFLTFAYWNDWWLSLMYIDDRNLFSLQAVLMSVERNIEFLASNATSIGVSAAKYAANMPRESMRMAMAVVIILPIACAYPFFQKYFVSGLTIGAVKG